MTAGQKHRWLQEELSLWQKDGLVTAEQAQKILARSSTAQPTKGAALGIYPRLLAFLGVLLIGEALILFISANWRAIPDAVKLLLIFGSVLSAYVLAYRLRFGKSPLMGLSSALFFKGAVAFGVGIFLIAQIYNFHADWRAGILYWFLGTLPLAYVSDSRPMLWLSLGTLALWLGTGFRLEGELIVLYQVLGAVLVLLAVPHWSPLPFPRFAKIYFSLGSGLILTTTLWMALELFGERFFYLELSSKFLLYYIVLLVLYLGLFISIALRHWGLFDRPRRTLVVLLSIVLIPGILHMSRQAFGPISSSHHPGDAELVSFTLLLFAECVGLMLFGDAMGTKAYLNLGLAYFLGLAVFEYFNDRWEYLPRALFFLAGGVPIMVLGYVLEKKRRKLAVKPEAGVVT